MSDLRPIAASLHAQVRLGPPLADVGLSLTTSAKRPVAIIVSSLTEEAM